MRKLRLRTVNSLPTATRLVREGLLGLQSPHLLSSSFISEIPGVGSRGSSAGRGSPRPGPSRVLLFLTLGKPAGRRKGAAGTLTVPTPHASPGRAPRVCPFPSSKPGSRWTEDVCPQRGLSAGVHPARGTHLQEADLLDTVLPGFGVHHLKYLGGEEEEKERFSPSPPGIPIHPLPRQGTAPSPVWTAVLLSGRPPCARRHAGHLMLNRHGDSREAGVTAADVRRTRLRPREVQ